MWKYTDPVCDSSPHVAYVVVYTVTADRQESDTLHNMDSQLRTLFASNDVIFHHEQHNENQNLLNYKPLTPNFY